MSSFKNLFAEVVSADEVKAEAMDIVDHAIDEIQEFAGLDQTPKSKVNF